MSKISNIFLLGIVLLTTLKTVTSKSTNNNNGGGGSSSSSSIITGGGGNSGFLHMFAAQQNPPDPCYEEIPIGLANQGSVGAVGGGIATASLATTVSSSGTVLR